MRIDLRKVPGLKAGARLGVDYHVVMVSFGIPLNHGLEGFFPENNRAAIWILAKLLGDGLVAEGCSVHGLVPSGSLNSGSIVFCVSELHSALRVLHLLLAETLIVTPGIALLGWYDTREMIWRNANGDSDPGFETMFELAISTFGEAAEIFSRWRFEQGL